MNIHAEVDTDGQHGPIVRIKIGSHSIAVYLMDETGVVTGPAGSYGIEVKGSWVKFKKQLWELDRINRGEMMGFPTKNSDGTPFREDNEYIKTLEAEIESLREELETANKRRRRWANIAARRVMEKDEWKQRVDVIRQWGSSFIMIGGYTFWEKFLMENPEAKDWFKEE